MPKYIIRIPFEPYAYAEAHYDSIKEYTDLHPEFAQAIIDTKKKIKEQITLNQEPFENDAFSK